MKPCYFCGKNAPVTFDHASLFSKWAEMNGIIAPFRSRFDGVRERLEWAAQDETDKGSHPECALVWAITEEGYAKRYPIVTSFDLT